MIPIQTILDRIPHIQFIGKNDAVVSAPVKAQIQDHQDDHIMWVSDKNADLMNSIHRGTVICSESVQQYNPDCNYIIVENPRLAFSNLISVFFVTEEKRYISASATIDASSTFGENCSIGENVVIEEGVQIGNNCSIGHNTVIKRNTLIGNSVLIGSNNTIGGVGFGYEKVASEYVAIPHIGNVVIEDFVEIGNNTCIDRAVLGSTILKRNAKIDNLVHIAHGCEIGANSLIIANAMVAGSVVVGKNVWVAPSSSILNKIEIADNVTIGMGAVVLKNVAENEVMIGNPAKPLVRK